MSHLIKPKLKVQHLDKEFDAECDADMRDDKTQKPINFCDEKFTLKLSGELEEKGINEYVTMTVIDKDEEEIGQLRLKVATLLGGGKNIQSHLKSHMPVEQQVKVLEEYRVNWYPLFSDLQKSPGQLQIATWFNADKHWVETLHPKNGGGCGPCCKGFCCMLCIGGAIGGGYYGHT